MSREEVSVQRFKEALKENCQAKEQGERLLLRWQGEVGDGDKQGKCGKMKGIDTRKTILRITAKTAKQIKAMNYDI